MKPEDDTGLMNADALLGDPSPADDWKLEPASHAARLKPGAEPLAQVLEDSGVEEIMRRYARHDANALQHQSSYRKYGRAEIFLGAAAAILGSVVLLLSDSDGLPPLFDDFRSLLLVVQLGCVSGAVGMKYLLQNVKPFEKWQVSRTGAESARIELFERVCGLGVGAEEAQDRSVSPQLLALRLAYFVRYQLQVQLDYYSGRGSQHRTAASRYVGTGAILTFVGVFAAGWAGLGIDLVDKVGFMAMVAMVAPILLAAQTSLSRLDQDERNAARYAITHDHLDRLSGKLSEVRRQAAAGNVAPVHAFIREVNEIISVEHKEWKSRLDEDPSPAST